MIIFDGLQIFGSHDFVQEQRAEMATIRRTFWGLNGTLEILGSGQGVSLQTYIWLHNWYATRQSIEEATHTLQSHIGRNATLQETDPKNNYVKTWERCTLEAVELQPMPGRESVSPILDIGRTIDGGWVRALSLRFFQLPEPDQQNIY